MTVRANPVYVLETVGINDYSIDWHDHVVTVYRGFDRLARLFLKAGLWRFPVVAGESGQSRLTLWAWRLCARLAPGYAAERVAEMRLLGWTWRRGVRTDGESTDVA